MTKEPTTININSQSKLDIGRIKGGVSPRLEHPRSRPKTLGGHPRLKDLRPRPDRPLGPSGPHPSPVCMDCPIHLEGDEWKDKLFHISGKPRVCHGVKKRSGCGGPQSKLLKIRYFRSAIERYLAAHPEEAAAREEVKA